MKIYIKLFLLIILFLYASQFSNNSYVYGQECLWYRQIITSNDFYIQKIASDKSGNFYLSAVGSGRIKLQDIDEVLTLDKAERELIIIKWDESGKLNWYWRYPNPSKLKGGYPIINSIKVNKSGDLIICGFEKSYFYDYSGFIIKINSKDGKTQQSIKLGKGVIPIELDFDNNNNIYVTGHYYDEQGEVEGYTYQTHGGKDILLAKYKNNGKLEWLKMFGGEFDDRGERIFINPDGNLILVGSFTDVANFDTKKLESAIMGDKEQDIFIGVFSQNGDCKSIKSLGSKGIDNIIKAFRDTRNNIFIWGYSKSPLIYNSEKLTNRVSTKYLIKFDQDINMKLIEILNDNNSPPDPYSYSDSPIEIDSSNNIYDSFPLGIARHMEDFTDKFGIRFEMGKTIELTNFTISKNDDCYIVGEINDDGNIGQFNFSKKGMKDYFIAKINLNYLYEEKIKMLQKEAQQVQQNEFRRDVVILRNSFRKFEVGSSIPFPYPFDIYKIKKETKIRMTEGGPFEEILYIVSVQDKELLILIPEYNDYYKEYTKSIGEIIITSDEFKSAKSNNWGAIGVNTKIEELKTDHIFYSGKSGLYYITLGYPDVQFILNEKDFIGNSPVNDEKGEWLKISDFKPNSKIQKIRLN